MRFREILLAALVVHLALNWLNFGQPGPTSAVGIEKGAPSPTALTEGSECMLVVFLDPECPRCNEVYAQAGQSTAVGDDQVELVWVMPETERERQDPNVIPAGTTLTFSDSLFAQFRVTGVPSAVLIQHNEVLGSGGIPPGADVRSFARSCVAEPEQVPSAVTRAAPGAGRSSHAG